MQEYGDGSFEGVVKTFSHEKGYGFISGVGSPDHWFHISQVQGPSAPRPGDKVRFFRETSPKGQVRATTVRILENQSDNGRSTASEKYNAPVGTNPCYGKATYERIGAKPIAAGALVGAMLGPSGAVIGAVLGAIVGTQRVEITSTCLRCGATGQVTARAEGRIGFQCPSCRKTWHLRDHA